ncbi:hypothetical protein NB718_003209 [Xanthomonas sacchari]|nr:hypothetical protein [Xanthomonas sacchari]
MDHGWVRCAPNSAPEVTRRLLWEGLQSRRDALADRFRTAIDWSRLQPLPVAAVAVK